MTLIVSIYDGKNVYAFGDFLITKDHKFGGVLDDIPAIWREGERPSVHVSSLRRKLYLLTPSVMFLWSGRVDIARIVYAKLFSIANDTNPFKKDRFMATLNEQKSENFAAQVIFLNSASHATVLHVNCTECRIPALGNVVIAGSGRDDFLDLLGDADRASGLLVAAKPYHRAAMIENLLIWLAIYQAHESVEARWGGGIETFISMTDFFVPVDHVVHSFAEMRRIGQDWEVRPHAYLFSKRYLHEGEHYAPNSELVLAEIDRVEQTADLHLIPPIFVPHENRLTMPDFGYASPFNDHYFFAVVASITLDNEARSLGMDAEMLLRGVTFEEKWPVTLAIDDQGRANIERYSRILIYGKGEPDPNSKIIIS